MNNLLIDIISSIVVNFFFMQYFSSYDKSKKGYIRAALFLLISMTVALINQLNNPFLNLMFTVISFVIIKSIIHDAPYSHNIVNDIFIVLSGLFIDSFCYFMSGAIYGVNSSSLYFFRSVSSSVMLIFFGSLFLRIFKKSSFSKVPKVEVLIFFLVSLFSLVLIYIFSIEYDYLELEIHKFFTIMIIFCLILLDLLIFHYMGYISKHYDIKEILYLENQRSKLTTKHYTSLKEQYDATRNLIHDFNNHLISVKTAYSVNNPIIAEKLILQFKDSCIETQLNFNTGIILLDIILNDKYLLASNLGIDFKFIIEDSVPNILSELDLITVFGNILDNAIEANNLTCKVRYKHIEIKIFMVESTMVIGIQNSCENKLRYDGSTLISTKNNHHGIGITSINKTIMKYNGNFNIEISDNICTTLIYLPILDF